MSLLSDSHARKGGAIHSYSSTSETQGQGTVTIRNSTIKNNSSDEVGGGMVFDRMARNEISKSTLTRELDPRWWRRAVRGRLTFSMVTRGNVGASFLTGREGNWYAGPES